MARNVLLLSLVLLAVALALWGCGVLGPRAGDVGDGPGADAGAADLATVADGTAPPGPAAAGLASGAPRVVARSTPPTVDGPRITGRVTDRAGKGVPQAHVISVPDTARKPFRAGDVGAEGCPAFDAVTDAQGRFAVAVRPDAPFHAVIAQAAGFGPAVRQDVPTYADVTIVLAPGAAIAGTVTDAEGKAVVGAKVRLFTLLDLCRRDLEATTREGGAYRIDGVPAFGGLAPAKAVGVGTAIEVTSGGFAPLLVAFNAWDLEPGQERRRDFVLVRGASLRGRIVEAESGRPVPSDGRRRRTPTCRPRGPRGYSAKRVRTRMAATPSTTYRRRVTTRRSALAMAGAAPRWATWRPSRPPSCRTPKTCRSRGTEAPSRSTSSCARAPSSRAGSWMPARGRWRAPASSCRSRDTR
jgi:hypothetical protein